MLNRFFCTYNVLCPKGMAVGVQLNYIYYSRYLLPNYFTPNDGVGTAILAGPAKTRLEPQIT